MPENDVLSNTAEYNSDSESDDLSSSTSVDFEALNSSDKFSPSLADTIAVRKALAHYLPAELVTVILDVATYWPCVTTSRVYHLGAAADESTDDDSKWTYLLSDAVPHFVWEDPKSKIYLPTRVKMVRFTIKSYSYGWTYVQAEQGTYRNSPTWFSVAIINPNDINSNPDWANQMSTHPVLLNPRYRDEFDADDYLSYQLLETEDPLKDKHLWHVQSNVHTISGKKRYHQVAWKSGLGEGGDEGDKEVDEQTGRGRGKGFIDSLKVGHRVALMARAQGQRWVNNVHKAVIDIYYSL